MRQVFVLIVAVVIVVVSSAQLDSLPEIASRWAYPAQTLFLGIPAWKWGGLGFILVISSLMGFICRSAFNRLTVIRDRHTEHKIAPGTKRNITRFGGLLGAALLANVLLSDLDLIEHRGKFEKDLHQVATLLIVVSAILLLYGWWDVLCDAISARAEGHRRAERLLIPMIRKFVRAIIVGAGLLLVVGLFFGSQTIGGMIAGLGLTGLVVALAAKDSVENLFGSITILCDMPFAIGDWVKIDKVEGAVEEINLRSTRIRTAEDTLINLPNANLIRASVENFGARRYRRQRVVMRVGYRSEIKAIEKYCDALREFVDAMDETVQEKTVLELDDPQEASVGVVAVWFMRTSSALEEAKARHRYLEKAIELRNEFGICFAPAAN